MRAVAFSKYGNSDVLETMTLPVPTLAADSHDVLIKIIATGVNPIDFKVRDGILVGGHDAAPPAAPVIVGWDGVGVVEKVSETFAASGYAQNVKVADTVWFAGDITRNGSYAEFLAIDGRTVAKAPEKYARDPKLAAAMPLTFQTAYEAMFEQMGIEPENAAANAGKTMLVMNGAGGLGAAAVQLGKMAGLTVVATASRPETIDFVKKMGADYVINHRAESLKAEMAKLKDGEFKVDYILNAHDNARFGEMVNDVLAANGQFAAVLPVSAEDWAKLDTTQLWFQRKSIHHTLMFSRAMTGTDVHMVGKAMANLSRWTQEGKISSHMTVDAGNLFGENNIRKAHDLQSSGSSFGKIVLGISA